MGDGASRRGGSDLCCYRVRARGAVAVTREELLAKALADAQRIYGLGYTPKAIPEGDSPLKR